MPCKGLSRVVRTYATAP